jgi:hypothetical protein
MRGSLFVSLIAFIGLTASRADELPSKLEKLPADVEVHMVGTRPADHVIDE